MGWPRGRPRKPVSAETRRKLSVALHYKWFDREYRRKQIEARLENQWACKK